MLFNSPFSSEKVDRLIELCTLPTNGRALEVGCGTGEFLMRVLARYDAHGIGIDRDARCIATANSTAAERGLNKRCSFHASIVDDVALDRGSFDLGICIGATHAYGEGEAAYPNTIRRLTDLVRPGGYVLIGEGYWKQPPAPEYLKLIGEPIGIYRDHAGNVTFAEQLGLLPIYATVSNDDEWDDFEWRHKLKLQREADANPDDPVAAERVTRGRAWRDGYLRWGRSTMGFGAYLFRVPREKERPTKP